MEAKREHGGRYASALDTPHDFHIQTEYRGEKLRDYNFSGKQLRTFCFCVLSIWKLVASRCDEEMSEDVPTFSTIENLILRTSFVRPLPPPSERSPKWAQGPSGPRA